MCSGVGKSGSPAPKPMTFSPCAFSALALASTARVADSAMRRRARCGRRRGVTRLHAATDRAGTVDRCHAGTVTAPRSTPDHASPPTCCPPTAASAAARPRSAPSRSTRSWPRRHDADSARRTARPPVKHLVGSVRAGLRRAVRPARRLGGRARQRRHDRVLGRRHVRADRAAQPAPRVRRVLVEVRRGRAPPRRTSTSRP